ncbi:MAG: chitosanase [Methylococcaceae bacterium]|nr:chitosanase [Methylococcaceae bacterium]
MKNNILKIIVPVLFSTLFLSTAYAKPKPPIPITPKGSITQQTPTYKWKAVSGATYYYLWSLDSSENLLFKGFSASKAGCEESKECSYKHSKKLSYGEGRWHVIAWNKGWGSWSLASHYNVKKKPKDALGFNKEQHLIADQFISIFENGTTEIKYDYAKDIDDGRGITAGRAGFTSATGDMLIVIEKYTELMPDNSLAQYQDELRKLKKLRYDSDGKTDDEREKDRIASGSTENLGGLIEEWKDNAHSQDFRDIQDQVVSNLYYKPALKKAKALGLKLPLSLLSLYDSNIMHGESGLDDLIKEATKMTDNLTPKEGADEITWLVHFNHNRRDVLIEAGSPWDEAVERITEFEDLIEEENTQLAPFEMIIEAYGDEKHILPTLKKAGSE